MKVDFLLAGTMRGGTSFFSRALREHPETYLPEIKEVHFFDRDRHFPDGAPPDYSVYHDFFSPPETARRIGEATPSYMYITAAPERIHAYNPDIDLIFLLRNPIERAMSHYMVNRRADGESLSFSEAIRQEPARLRKVAPAQHIGKSYVDRGFYTRQISHFLQWFSRDQMIFLKTEDVRADPRTEFAKVFDFLGLAPMPSIREKSFSNPHVDISDLDRAYLQGVYRDEFDELEQLLGWDLSEWRRD
jgi:hypothetical protein